MMELKWVENLRLGLYDWVCNLARCLGIGFFMGMRVTELQVVQILARPLDFTLRLLGFEAFRVMHCDGHWELCFTGVFLGDFIYPYLAITVGPKG